MKYYDEPCEHRWWQHRHPNSRMRLIGQLMMALGLFEIAIGLGLILR